MPSIAEVPAVPEDVRAIVADLECSYELSEAWQNSPYRWLKQLLPAVKGRLGEQLFEKLATRAGAIVEPHTDKGHDRIADDVKVEIKLSTLYDTSDPDDATYKWLQLRPSDDYDVVALIGVAPQSLHLWVIDKDTALEHATGQHGGKDATETRQLEISPDQLPDWLGDDHVTTPATLCKKLAQHR